ncbi:hypothetical protein [Massilia litorea]|uniref:Uncharacterized protein n=1 Tax=Massilia litorea TaxID=2769491 RepID=A0A7L9U585_9BURK|nr:hypothetical protein [Massilia litorea]QOL50233.1 hypothetical protein LPB04_02655 [Massilia litorea]
MEQKPKLNLLKPDKASKILSLKTLFTKLTGREPTEEELAEAKRMLKSKNPRN